MPPVKSVSSPDVDNEATAELPVLDVDAYESSLAPDAETAHTDTWVLPQGTFKPAPPGTDATAEMPAAYDLDHSGTHEMPAMMPAAPKRKAKSDIKSQRKPAAGSAKSAPPVAPPPVETPQPPRVDELRASLSAAERRILELEERARIADAERAVALERVNSELQQLRQQLAARLEAQATTRELETARAQLLASQERCEILDCDVANLRATVGRRNAQIQMLEADMNARQNREATLSARLEAALALANPDVAGLREAIAQGESKLADLKAELQHARSQLREKENDLEVAEESIRQLENDVRDKSRKLEEASITIEEWRAVIAESQKSLQQRDGRIQQLEADLQQHRFASTLDTGAQTGEQPALEGPARVLIRTDGNTDFVHVLGRRTRIGRGTDNEVVIDTKHVSRYHAVLLAGPVNTSIEDLNSTNGVFVNGKRVTRQVLQDGDRVTVGRTQFRYTVRD